MFPSTTTANSTQTASNLYSLSPFDVPPEALNNKVFSPLSKESEFLPLLFSFIPMTTQLFKRRFFTCFYCCCSGSTIVFLYRTSVITYTLQWIDWTVCLSISIIKCYMSEAFLKRAFIILWLPHNLKVGLSSFLHFPLPAIRNTQTDRTIRLYSAVKNNHSHAIK